MPRTNISASCGSVGNLQFIGTEATLYAVRGRYEIHPERRSQLKYDEPVLGQGGRGQDHYKTPDSEFLHLTNWVEWVRSRRRPNAPAEAGVSAVAAAHLANQALRAGQVAQWKS